MNTDKDVYITFHSKTDLYKLEKIFESHDIDYKIKPTPRNLGTACLSSLVIEYSDYDKLDEILYAYTTLNVKSITITEKKKFFI